MLKHLFLTACLAVVSINAAIIKQRIIFDKTCIPPRGDVCLPIRECPYFSDLLDKSPIPRPRSVIQIIRKHQCGFLINAPKVCCSLTDKKGSQNGPSHSRKYQDKLKLLPVDNCGSISRDYRITGGSETSLLEFPWMALIAYQTENGLDFRCSGTILNNFYILTAAHCLQNMTFVGVRIGEHDINSKKDCDPVRGYCLPPVQDFYIEEIFIHPMYNQKTYDNDIGLVRLATPANLTYDNAKPICLPIEETTNLDGRIAVIAGWGVTEMGHKNSKLLKTSVPVIPLHECKNMYQDYMISDKQICAGGYMGRDSCGGDSGGPLKYVSKVRGTAKYVQYGIVSFGPKHCGADGQPAVYTDVTKYVDWILDTIEP